MFKVPKMVSLLRFSIFFFFNNRITLSDFQLLKRVRGIFKISPDFLEMGKKCLFITFYAIISFIEIA